MTKHRLSSVIASVGVALICATAAVHFAAYQSVVSRVSADVRPIVAAAWVAGGVSLILAALLAIAATPLFVVRRRALLAIAALTPLSIAVLQIIYLGFIPPTALLLVDGGILLVAGVLGQASQALPATRHDEVL
jgi:hypothetical protein